MTLHPPHGLVMAKHLKKHGLVLPAQACLVSKLLSQEETIPAAGKALIKASAAIKTWFLNFENENSGMNELLTHALDWKIFGKCYCQYFDKMELILLSFCYSIALPCLQSSFCSGSVLAPAV